MDVSGNESGLVPASRRIFTTADGHGYEDYLVFVMFWALAAIVFSQFFSRYVLNSSLAWTEEIARFFLVAVTFLGIPIGVRKGTHIMVEIFCRLMPPRLERATAIVIHVVSLGFYAYGTYLAYLVTRLVKNQRISSFDISKSVLYGIVCAGFLIMALRCAEAIWSLLRSPADAR